MYIMIFLLDALHLGRQPFSSSCTIVSRHLHYFVSKFTQPLPVIQALELPSVVITSATPRELLTTVDTIVRLFTIVRSYVIQGQGVAIRYYNFQYHVVLYRVGFQEDINILTGNAKYQNIDVYYVIMLCILKCGTYCYHKSHLRTTKSVIFSNICKYKSTKAMHDKGILWIAQLH